MANKWGQRNGTKGRDEERLNSQRAVSPLLCDYDISGVVRLWSFCAHSPDITCQTVLFTKMLFRWAGYADPSLWEGPNSGSIQRPVAPMGYAGARSAPS